MPTFRRAIERLVLEIMIAGAGASAMIGIVACAILGLPTPDVLVALASAALGSLATALTRSLPPPEYEEAYYAQKPHPPATAPRPEGGTEGR